MAKTPAHMTMARYRLGCRCRACRRAMRVNEDHKEGERLLEAHPELAWAVVPLDAHGTLAGYSKHGCRCPRCLSAWESRPRAKDRKQGIPEQMHGTDSCYVGRGCRCPKCTAAHTAYVRNYREQQKMLSGQVQITEETK